MIPTDLGRGKLVNTGASLQQPSKAGASQFGMIHSLAWHRTVLIG